MANMKELYKRLEVYRKDFDVDENIDKFIETVEQIVECKDPSSISVLLSYFNDSDRIDFVFENLKSNIEQFDDEIYVQELLRNIHIMLPHALEWATWLLYRVLNHPSSNRLIDKYIYLTDYESLKSILNFMIEEDPDHPQRQRINELLAKLGSVKE